VSLNERHGYGIGTSSIRRRSNRRILLDRDWRENGFRREDERTRRLTTRALRIRHIEREGEG